MLPKFEINSLQTTFLPLFFFFFNQSSKSVLKIFWIPLFRHFISTKRPIFAGYHRHNKKYPICILKLNAWGCIRTYSVDCYTCLNKTCFCWLSTHYDLQIVTVTQKEWGRYILSLLLELYVLVFVCTSIQNLLLKPNCELKFMVVFKVSW